MTICPFCKAAASEHALKCEHCGEWLDGRTSGTRSELGKAATRFVNVYIAMTVIGLILTILLFVFFVGPGLMSVRRTFFPG